MLGNFLLFCSVLFLGYTAAAVAQDDECKLRRLDAQGEPYRYIHARSQSKTGTCYAYAAAGMADALRARKAKTYDDFTKIWAARVSAINVALQAKIKADLDDPLRGGSFCSSYRKIARQGFCPDYAIPNVFKGKKSTPAINELRSFYETFQKNRNEDLASEVLVYLQFVLELNPEEIPSETEIATYLEEQTPGEYLKSIISYRCETEELQQRVSLPKCNSLKNKTANYTSIFSEKVLAELSKKKTTGAAVAMCSQVLREGKEVESAVSDGKPLATCKKHVVLVIGKRRTSDGDCQVLIRNSWGSGCKKYSKNWECNDGDVWVDTHILFKNTFGVSYLGDLK